MRAIIFLLTGLLAASALSGCTTLRDEEGDRPRAQAPPESLYQMMRRVPGIVFMGNGQVRVRGYADPPLYVVDGVQVQPQDVRFINPYDVENIRVLDGADATLYGMLGTNGVIQIRTRTPGAASAGSQEQSRWLRFP